MSPDGKAFFSLMKRLRWQIVVVLATLGVVSFLLLIQKPQAAFPVPAQPASGGVYVEAIVGAFGRLNPWFDYYNQADRDVDRLLFSSLLTFDGRGLPRPDLAESWGISQDGTVYNFTLRPNAVWHDGQPVTSDDILFTLDIIRTGVTTYPEDVRALWNQVQAIRLDDKNLKFVLPEPFAPFLSYLTFGVLPKHLLDNVPPDQLINHAFNLSPVGSGPYRFEQLIVENGQIRGVILTANEAYHGQTPRITQFIIRYYASAAEALTAYREGEVLGIGNVTPEILAEALLEPNLNLYTARLPRLTLVLFNLQNDEVSFFQDKSVRRALFYALNRRYLVDRILQGQAVIANSVVPPGNWASYEGIETVPYDPEQAQALLKEAGYVLGGESPLRAKEGKILAFTLLYPDDALHARLAQTIQENWAAIGVGVTLQAVDYASLLNDYLVPRRYQAALVDLDMSNSADPDPYPFWHQSEALDGQNYAQWDNRSASEYLEQARVLTLLDSRARLYRNFQVVFAKEWPALPLYYPVYTYGVDSRVQGVQIAPIFNPADRFAGVPEWYMVVGREAQPSPTPIVTP